MAAVFRPVLLAHGQRNGIHAQAGVDIRRVGLNIVDFQSKRSHRGDEALQIFSVFQFQMHFKVIGTVFEVDFKRRKQRQTAYQRRVADNGYRIQPRADGQPDNAARPECNGGRQALNLVFRAVQNRIAADNGDSNHRRGGNQRHAHARKALIQHHRHGRRQRNENKRPLARRMALAGALTADNRRKNDGYGHPKQNGIQVQLG